MRCKRVVTKKPRFAFLLADEIDGHVRAPGRLVVLGRNAVFYVWRGGPIVEFLPARTLLGKPLGVGVLRPVRLGMMRPVEDFVTIINALLHNTIGAGGQVQLARKAAGVTGIGQEAADEFLCARDCLSVLPAACGAWIAASKERGPARSANRALAIGLGKRHTLSHQCINIWRVDVRVAQGVNGVVALLIGTDPQDVGLIWHVRWINQLANLGELCLSLRNGFPKNHFRRANGRGSCSA